MSKPTEADLLAIIMTAAKRVVKSLASTLESGGKAEELVEQVEAASRACFAPVLEALIEGRREEAERARDCPQCGQKMQHKGEQERGWITPLGLVHWRRAYFYCPHCRQGYHPLDAAWGIGPGQFTQRYRAGMTLLGACLPYRQASQVFTKLTGMSVSAEEVLRTTAREGKRLEEARSREQQAWLEEGPPTGRPREPQTWVCGLDAAQVRFRDGWHEVKVGAVAPLQKKPPQSYAVEVGAMEQAGEKLYAEVVRRGGDPGRDEMVCVADGAPGNWNQFALHFPRRVEVLDWYHATEHLWAAAHGVYGEGTAAAKAWEERAERALWEGRPQEVLELLAEAAREPKGEAAAAEVHYFATNRGRMLYPQYRERKYPIGSGMVESACKQVILARARGAGMSWTKEGLQPVLAVRAEFLSDRFHQAWALIHPRTA